MKMTKMMRLVGCDVCVCVGGDGRLLHSTNITEGDEIGFSRVLVALTRCRHPYDEIFQQIKRFQQIELSFSFCSQTSSIHGELTYNSAHTNNAAILSCGNNNWMRFRLVQNCKFSEKFWWIHNLIGCNSPELRHNRIIAFRDTMEIIKMRAC